LSHVYTVILGGGRGSRLFPLTRDRAKPAVPVAGKYRLIDIPLSNAINSGYRHIAVLTQFNSASLNHHISQTYRFDMFGEGQVDVLAAEQTAEGNDWYQGTADAIRKAMRHLSGRGVEHLLILSGDHLYRMDYRDIVSRHLSTNADATVSVIGVERPECAGFGILQCDDSGRILTFVEKPQDPALLDALEPPPALRSAWGLPPERFLASMGVYVFRFDVLARLLEDPTNMDFGKDILPAMLHSHRLQAHLFEGYWRDIGTIGAFYDANLALTSVGAPPFRFYHSTGPIYTHQRFLPASKFSDCHVRESIVSEGCILQGAALDRCVVGIRARVQPGARLQDVILMGADVYESDELRASNLAKGIEAIGVGPGCEIERAIIDKNARIGAGCNIRGAVDRPDADGDGWYVRDGIVIVPKDAQLKAGTVV